MWLEIRGVIVGGPAVWAGASAKIIKAVLTDCAMFWRNTMLKRHFEPSAYVRYQYRRRTARYVRAKVRRFGVDLPWVWSGDTRRTVKLLPTVRGTAQRVWIRVPVPKHVNYLGSLREELTRVNEEERRAVTRLAVKRVAEHMDAAVKRSHAVKIA